MARAKSFFRLFARLASVTAATVAAGCSSEIDNSEFAANVCENGQYAPLAGVTTSTPVDYIVLSRIGYGAPVERGTPCVGATDGACAAKLASPPDGSWEPPRDPNSDIGPVRHSMAYTHGADVGFVTSLAELKTFLAPIDTPGDAALLVTETLGHRLLCRGNNVRGVTGGFELATTSGGACGANTHRDEHIVFVSTSGDIAIRETVVVERGSANCSVGRRPEGLAAGSPPIARDRTGMYFADVARLEAASVHAFARLATELEAHGAPSRLVRRARRARADEVRHARMTRALALRHGARPTSAHVRRLPTRSLFAVLCENAVEGCVRETYGALVATYQARHAEDEAVAGAMRTIAADETRHAALAWDIATWAEGKLTEEERAQIRSRRDTAIDDLASALRTEQAHPAVGLPNGAEALRLLRGLFAELR
ncbi:hypothetical protein BH09MYX1_BH09MYX1_55580 [soil metagenome]